MSPLLNSLLALSATISTAYSLPSGWTANERRGTPTLPLSDVSNTGASLLPTPSTHPKYITLGLGFQNYTCSASGTYVQTVPSTGAVADLYDLTLFLTPYTHDTITKTTLQAFEVCLSATHCSPSPQNSYCGACHTIAAAPYRLGQKGFHYFDQLNGAQTPNFDLYAGGDFLSAKRAGDVKATVGAYDGENGLGAIDWLYLADNGSGRSHGLKSVYRVETAGGVAPKTCTPGAQLQVPYAAEYWFY